MNRRSLFKMLGLGVASAAVAPLAAKASTIVQAESTAPIAASPVTPGAHTHSLSAHSHSVCGYMDPGHQHTYTHGLGGHVLDLPDGFIAYYRDGMVMRVNGEWHPFVIPGLPAS